MWVGGGGGGKIASEASNIELEAKVSVLKEGKTAVMEWEEQRTRVVKLEY